MIVAKRVSFDAAHFLPNYEGKCHNLHGHTWKVEIAVEGPVDNQTDMVVDFAWLKEALQAEVIDKFDHTLLNDRLTNPTAENLARLIYDKIRGEWTQGPNELVQLKWVKVWETEDSYVQYEGE